MKTKFALILLIITIASCTKTSETSIIHQNSNAFQAIEAKKKTNEYYLLSQTWRYNKYYLNYVDSSHPGNLVYDRSAGIHAINIGADTVKFFSDGKVIEGNKRKTTQGKWSFTDSTQTVVKIIKNNAAYFYNIKLIDKSHLNWTLFINGSGTIYAEMIPKN